MGDTIEGYRAFPKEIIHPSKAKQLTHEAFQSLKRSEMQSAGSVCKGHIATTIWYIEEPRKYIIDVHLEPDRHIYVESICTFSPKFGMDSIDGMFAQDIEEYILERNLGFKSNRIAIYGDKDSIDTTNYLAKHGVLSKPTTSTSEQSHKKPWWRFW